MFRINNLLAALIELRPLICLDIRAEFFQQRSRLMGSNVSRNSFVTFLDHYSIYFLDTFFLCEKETYMTKLLTLKNAIDLKKIPWLSSCSAPIIEKTFSP